MNDERKLRQIGWRITRLNSDYDDLVELERGNGPADRKAGFRQQPVYIDENEKPK